jgi:nicotinate-nucleotide adenylyltransferase
LTEPAARRLGVYGGAFDPPHNAHVALARAAVEQLQLDALHIIPTGQAWHKARTMSSAEDRLAMVRLAFEGLSGVVIDTRELQRAGPSYTIDTLGEIRAEEPGAEVYLLMGADQYAALPSWHRWREVVENAIISIADRSDQASSTPDLSRFEGVSPRTRAIRWPSMPVSATDIRQRASQAQGIDHLVPGAVARYIDSHHLYQNFDDSNQH